MHTFKTRSSARRSILTVVYTYIPMFLLAFLGLRVAVITWLYFEAILLVTFGFCMLLVGKTHWEIEFREGNIRILNTGNHQSYFFEHLRRSDLTIKQSKGQKAKNRCDFRIGDTPFRMYDVERCSEMLQYIETHIPEKRVRTKD